MLHGVVPHQNGYVHALLLKCIDSRIIDSRTNQPSSLTTTSFSALFLFPSCPILKSSQRMLGTLLLAVAVAAEVRPNIVFFLVDDLGKYT